MAVSEIAVAKKVAGVLLDQLNKIRQSRQKKRDLEVVARLQTDLHYVLTILDRMQERQGILLEQYQIVALQAISANLGLVRDQIQPLISMPGDILIDSQSPDYAPVQNSFVAARQSIQKFPLASPSESSEAVALAARWQMTESRSYHGYPDSMQYREWTILTYLYEQRYVQYIAVAGNDPASASVRHLSARLTAGPKNDNDWQRLLDQAVQRFGDFVALPGTGIYDLVVRLEKHRLHILHSGGAGNVN